VEAQADHNEAGPLKSEYLDVIVSDVRVRNDFAFSVQILNTEGRDPVWMMLSYVGY